MHLVVMAQITVQECTNCISRKLNTNNFKILDFKLTSLDEKSGFLGEHFRLNITVEDIEKQVNNYHCFAKFLPTTQAQIDFCINCGAFTKEIFIYNDLFPKIQQFCDFLKDCVPECYYTKPNYVLVFEDVTERGLKPLPRYGSLDYDHIVVILKTIVKFHAASLLYEEKISKLQNKNYRLSDEYFEYFYETFYVDKPEHKGGQGVYAAVKGLFAGIKLFAEPISDEVKENIKKAGRSVFDLVKPSKKYRNVICHGDLWSTNIMMSYSKVNKPEKCVLIDFQTARYLPPAHDVMSFLHLTTTRDFRTKYLKTLQDLYYTELQLFFQNYDCTLPITYEEFMESCEEQKRFAVIQAATYCQLTQVKDKAVKEFIQDNQKWDDALYVDRGLMVIENCKNDPEYREIIKDTLQEVLEMCKKE